MTKVLPQYLSSLDLSLQSSWIGDSFNNAPEVQTVEVEIEVENSDLMTLAVGD